MRSLLLVVLSFVLAIAPALQASACLCESSVECSVPAAKTQAPDCCCHDAVCACSGCAEHRSDERTDPAEALGGCGCTKVQPQWNAEPDVKVELASAPAPLGQPATAASLRATRIVPTIAGRTGPPQFRPLLL